MNLREFVTKHNELLQIEREAEIEETSALLENVPLKELQHRGVCLLRLRPTSHSTGLYGRTLVIFTLDKGHGDGNLPAHNISSGTIVGVSPSHKGGAPSKTDPTGIVSRVLQTSITVAFEHRDTEGTVSFDHDQLYRLTKLANDVTYRRLKRALSELGSNSPGPASHLIDVLFNRADVQTPTVLRTTKTSDFQLFNTSLNPSQKEAVTFALCQQDIAIIHGPPGTGKTTTVIEVIRQAIKMGIKVLACAPSNIAVDNLVEQLAASKLHIVRIGHPARLLPSIQQHALDAIVASSDEGAIVRDVRLEIDQTRDTLAKCKQGSEKRHLRNEIKTLRKELHHRERLAVRGILQRADVVLATNIGASPAGPLSYLPKNHFGVTVIDECAQALEASCWIPLLYAPCCILAGDHQQLPPTILSDKAAANGLSISLMERAVALHSDKITKLLTTQYRMNSVIMRWSSEALYSGRLTAAPSVASHLLRDLPGVDDTEDTSTALLLIDTAGCMLEELDVELEASKGNEGEVHLVAGHVQRLVSSGLAASDIAVIAPYNLQVDLLKLRLGSNHPHLEIKSVDGFQGREKEAVIISLVRSNSRGEVGFLAENRRINVAVTRARRHVTIICDSETVRNHDFLRNLVDYMMANGEVRSAHQYLDDIDMDVASARRPDYLIFRSQTKTQNGRKSRSTKRQHPTDRKYALPEAISSRKFDAGVSARKEEELTQAVTSFYKDKSMNEIMFPTALNSHDRLVIHQLAERLGMLHFSTGEGKDRQVTICKQENSDRSKSAILSDATVADNATETTAACGNAHVDVPLEGSRTGSTDNEEDDGLYGSGFDDMTEPSTCLNTVPKPILCKTNTKPITETTSGYYKCQFCKKKFPPGNLFLHEISCEKIAAEKQRRNVKATAGKAKTKPDTKRTLERTTETDFDKLITIATATDNRCNFACCKEKISLTGVLCAYCNRRYCYGHNIPEVHGCGNMARADARKILRKEKEVFRGSGVRERRVDPERKAALERKMDKKRNTMEEKRKRKSSKN